MHPTSFWSQHAAWLVFLITGLAAVTYILLGTHPWVAGDARAYLDTALGLIGTKGYALDAISRNTFLRAPWYILTLSAIALPLQSLDEPTLILTIRLSQALLLSLNVMLIFQVGRLLGLRQREAFLAVGLTLCYAPFYRMTGCLLVETQVMTFLLLGIYFWLKERPTLSGIFLFLGLGNSGLSLWPKLLVLILLSGIALWQEPTLRQKLLKPLTILLSGALLMTVAGWLIPHQPLNPNGLWYYADTGGWIPLVITSGMQSLISENGFAALQRYYQAQPEGWEGLARWLLHHSSQALLLLGNNFFQIFARPDNVYRQAWLFLGTQGQILYHQFLLIAALMSYPLLFSSRRLWLCWFWLPVWTVYAIDHTETRYNLPWIPFAILLATWFLTRLSRQHRFAVVTLILLLVLAQAPSAYPWLLIAFPSLPLNLFIGLMLGTSILVFCIFIYQAGGARLQRFLPLTCLAIPVFCHFLLVPPDTHWSTQLTTQPTIEKILHPSVAFWQPAGLTTFLLIDAQPPISPTTADLAITVNGFPIDARNPAPAVLQQLKYLRGGLLPPDSMHQYRMLSLSPAIVHTIQANSRAVVQIGLNPTFSKPVALYGDYPVNHQTRFAIPDPDWSDYSVYKAYYDGDGRPSLDVTALTSQSRLLKYPMSNDLSPSPGLQTGQYRILLLRLLPADAANPMMPAPSFSLDSQKGQLVKTIKLAY